MTVLWLSKYMILFYIQRLREIQMIKEAQKKFNTDLPSDTLLGKCLSSSLLSHLALFIYETSFVVFGLYVNMKYLVMNSAMTGNMMLSNLMPLGEKMSLLIISPCSSPTSCLPSIFPPTLVLWPLDLSP